MPTKSSATLALIPPGQMKMNAAETHIAVMAWQGLEIFSLTGAPPAAPEAAKAEAPKGEAATSALWVICFFFIPNLGK